MLRPDENFSKTWCQTQTFRKEGINRNKVELLEESNKKGILAVLMGLEAML